jgi:hypothetical protein
MKKPTAAAQTTPRNGAIQTLSHVAFLANRLAKQLSGRDRALAYQIKSAALSALILAGAANPNGLRPDATVGLDLLSDPQCRLHVPISQLQPEAQAIVRRQTGSIPRVASLAERLTPEQMNSLATFFEHRAA